MSSFDSQITALILSRPGPSAISQLAAHVAAQAKGEIAYNFDAIRLLIKLFMLHPDAAAEHGQQASTTALASLLVLRQYPNMTDFLALAYMIPPNIMASEPCASIQACADALDACQYAQFWSLLEKLQQSSEHALVAALAKDSKAAFSSGILSVLALTYRQAPASVVMAAIKVDSLAGVTALQHKDVEFVSASENTVNFKETTENTKRERVFQESVGFGAITNLMMKLAQ